MAMSLLPTLFTIRAFHFVGKTLVFSTPIAPGFETSCCSKP
jgi:hypothetical protein